MIKNYKIPEWFKHEEITLDMAERLIAYKRKTLEVWLEYKTRNKLMMYTVSHRRTRQLNDAS